MTLHKPRDAFLHSRADVVVPFLESMKLLADSGLPGECREPQAGTRGLHVGAGAVLG